MAEYYDLQEVCNELKEIKELLKLILGKMPTEEEIKIARALFIKKAVCDHSGAYDSTAGWCCPKCDWPDPPFNQEDHIL